MEEQDKVLEQEQKDELAVIEEMKAKMDNMVDPEEFKKLEAKYNKLLNEYVNKRPAPKKEVDETRPAADIAKEIAHIGDTVVTNREYIAKSLEYRQTHIKEFGTDPWTDYGTTGPSQPTAQTKKVADVLQSLVDNNPDPSSFRVAFDAAVKDNKQLLSKLKRRK